RREPQAAAASLWRHPLLAVRPPRRLFPGVPPALTPPAENYLRAPGRPGRLTQQFLLVLFRGSRCHSGAASFQRTRGRLSIRTRHMATERLSAAELLRQACAELEQRLHAGQDCAAEGWLNAQPDLANHAEYALELIYAEFVQRERLGQRPTPE